MQNKTIILLARIILGALLVIFGLNKIFFFMPMTKLPPGADELMSALAQSGYIFPLLIVVEIGTGILLLINRFIPLALILLAPLSVNIMLFHMALDPLGIGAAAIVFLLNLFLLISYRDKYSPLLKIK